MTGLRGSSLPPRLGEVVGARHVDATLRGVSVGGHSPGSWVSFPGLDFRGKPDLFRSLGVSEQGNPSESF